MTQDIYFRIIFGVLWIMYIAIRVPHENTYKQIEKKHKTGFSREKILVSLQFVGMGIIPWIWILSPWFDDFSIASPVLIRLLGVLVALFSLWLFWITHQTLGENWSPILELRKGHKLIKSGPYKRIRHPMYTQIWLWSFAQALIISNWVAGFSGVLLWAILYFMRIRKEEEMMIQEFGVDYEEYMKETGRVFPKI